MESKKTNWVTVLIVILVIVIIGLSGFIIYDKFINNGDDERLEIGNNNGDDDSSQTTTDDQNGSSNQNNNQESENYVQDISIDDLNLILDKRNRYSNAFEGDYPISDFESFSNLLSNQEKLQAVVSYMNASSRLTSFTKDDLKAAFDSFFPVGVNYSDESIECSLGHIQYQYNSSTGVYTDVALGHGTGSIISFFHYLSGSYDSSTQLYTVKANVLYGGYCEDSCPYSKYYDTNKFDNLIYHDSNLEMNPDSVYELVKDKLPVVTYEFRKNNSGDFILVSVN